MFHHFGDLMLGAEERASQIDGDGLVPAGLGDPGGGAGFTQGAGIVEGDIKFAETLHRQGHQALGIAFVAHIAGQSCGLTTGRLDLGHQARQLAVPAGADHDLGAFGGE